jgi:hypothetical protein
MAIFPSKHPLNRDILYLQEGKLDKPSYVQLEPVSVPISRLRTYTKGASATASEIRLTDESCELLFTKLGMRAPDSWERGFSVGERTLVLPSPALSNQGILSTQYGRPDHPQISACEHTPLITNAQRSHRQFNTPCIRGDYGSTSPSFLPPPVTWRRRRISRVYNSFNRIDWGFVIQSFVGILFILLLGFILITTYHAIWAFICRIFIEIRHFFISIWDSIKGFIGHEWSSFAVFLSNSWESFIAWLKSLVGK